MPTIVTVGVYTVIIVITLNINFFHFSTFTDKETEAQERLNSLLKPKVFQVHTQDACYVKVFIANHPRPFCF